MMSYDEGNQVRTAVTEMLIAKVALAQAEQELARAKRQRDAALAEFTQLRGVYIDLMDSLTESPKNA